MNESNLTGKANGEWEERSLFDVNETPWLNYTQVSWAFTFPNGSGYYRFTTSGIDNVSNTESLDDRDETNGTECYFNNSYPNQPSRNSPTGTSVSRNADLNWSCTDPDDDAVLRYDVYFGTDSTPDSGELKVSNQSATDYNLGTLSYSTTYYWKIIVWDEHNATNVSDVWSFKTESDDSGGGGGGPSGGGFAPPGDQTAPSVPENVSCISVIVDTTPSFTWSAASDNEGVEGYYVKIDDGTEIAVGNVLNWTADTLSDGSYVFYVRAEDAAGNSGPYGNCSFTVNTSTADSMIPVADAGGPYSTALTNSSLLFDGSVSFDPDGSIVNYTWNFGDGEHRFGSSVNYRYNSSGEYNVTLTVTDDDGLMDDDTVMITILSDADGDGWSDEVEQSYNSDDDDPFDGPLDSDGDGIPDDGSPDGKYLGDTDDDNDGVSDSIEEQFGSDPQNESDVSGVTIENRTYYLIDADGDGVFDGAYLNEENDVSITKNDDNYLIDTDGDGTWDYEYDETLGEVTEYEEETKPSGGIPWLFIIIGTIAVIISILLILIKMGYISIKME